MLHPSIVQHLIHKHLTHTLPHLSHSSHTSPQPPRQNFCLGLVLAARLQVLVREKRRARSDEDERVDAQPETAGRVRGGFRGGGGAAGGFGGGVAGLFVRTRQQERSQGESVGRKGRDGLT